MKNFCIKSTKISRGIVAALGSCCLILAANFTQAQADSSTRSETSISSSNSSLPSAEKNSSSSLESSGSSSAKQNSVESSSKSDQVKASDETDNSSMTDAAAMNALNHMGGETMNYRRHTLMRSAEQLPDSWFIGDQARPKVLAVDVASYQSGLTQENYKQLANLGVKTIIVKATEGSTYTNPFALTQMKYAANAGMNVALYQFATYKNTNEARSEANYLISWLKGNKVNHNILIISDMEANSATVSSIGTNMQAFQNTVSAAGYSNQGFYTSAAYQYLSNLVAIDGAKRGWIAQYPYHPSNTTLLNSNYGAWQLSSTTKIANHSGYLDASYDYTGLLATGAGTDPFGTTNNYTSNTKPKTNTTTKQEVVKSPYTLKTSKGKTYAYKNNKKVSGWVAIGQRRYYFRSGDGVMLHNWQTINGKTYYFRLNDGVMLRSWQTINGKTYYFYIDGKMLRNWQHIGGKIYYFYKDGKLLRNWQTIAGKHYYFYKDGKLLRDYQKIDGKLYHFDKVTGELLK